MPGHDRAARRPRVTTRAQIVVAALVAVLGCGTLWLVPGLLGAAASIQPARTLDPELVRRFDAAARVAAADGVTLQIVSGLRTPAEQQALIDQASTDHGSELEARRWVAPVHASAHVAGRALDVGPAEGAAWLAEHGAEYGLCRVFDNEPWHVEATVEPGGVCPATVPDASGLWP